MRTTFAALAGSLLLSGCVSGTRVVYVPVPSDTVVVAATPAPSPAPVEVAPPPVAVTIVRAEQNRLLVSLDRPSYLAVFDIAPGRGVTLLYPTSTRQRQMTLVGARWLDPRWGTLNRYDAASSGRYARNESLTHYVYAVASARPLRLDNAAFDDDLLANMLGVRASRVDDPYDARDAIVRQFVAAARDEDWGEDMYVMEAMRSTQVVRVARVYCADGSVVYVRDELADRALCPRNVSLRGEGWGVRPDSVIAWNGRRVSHRYDPNVRTPVYRIPRTIGGHTVGRTAEGGENGNNGNDGSAGNNGNGGNVGNGGDNGHRGNGNSGAGDNNGNHYGWRNGNNGNGNNGNGNNDGNSGNGNPPATQPGGGVQQQGHPQGSSNGNSNGNSQGNSNAQSHGRGNAPDKDNPHSARPESQPAPEAAAQPAAAPSASKPAKPAGVGGVLKRAGEKKAPAKPAADSTGKTQKPR